MPAIPRSPILAGVYLHQEQLIWISEASQELDEIERKLARPLDGLRFHNSNTADNLKRRDSPPKLPTMRRSSKSSDKGSIIVHSDEGTDASKLRKQKNLVVQPPPPSPSTSSNCALSPTSPTAPLRHTRLNSTTSTSSSTRSGSSYASSAGRASISTSSTSDGVPVISLGHIAEDADLDEIACQLDELARKRSDSSYSNNSASPNSVTSFRAVDWGPVTVGRTADNHDSKPSGRGATPKLRAETEESPASPSTTPKTVYKVSLGHISPETDLNRLAEELDELATHTFDKEAVSPVTSLNHACFQDQDGRQSNFKLLESSLEQKDKRKKRDVPLIFTSEPGQEYNPLAYTRSSVSSGNHLFVPVLPISPSHPQLKPSTAKKVPRQPISRSSPLYRLGSKESDDSPLAILVDTSEGKQRKHITLAEALRDAELEEGTGEHVVDVALTLPAGKQETASPLRIRFPERLTKAQSSDRRRTQSAPSSPGEDVVIISDWLDGWRMKYDPTVAYGKSEAFSFETNPPHPASQRSVGSSIPATCQEATAPVIADWYTFSPPSRTSSTSAVPISKQTARPAQKPPCEASAKANKDQTTTKQTSARQAIKQHDPTRTADVQHRRRAQTGLEHNGFHSPKSPSLRVRFADVAQ